MNRKNKRINIGFISTRIAGTDGASLEIAKWAEVLESLNCRCFYFAGECDRPEDVSQICELAHFNHPDMLKLHEKLFSSDKRDREATRKINSHTETLKNELYSFIKKFNLEVIIPQNALAIPVNIPLGIALTQLIAETGVPTIAHHHDFFWERKRFLRNCVWDYLNMSFPPSLPCISHVVINSSARNQLSLRTGISSTLIPNVMDYQHPPQPPNGYGESIRKDLGIEDDEMFILQPTRVVQRKGIEHAVELASRIRRKSKLVISHASGDEGDRYEKRIREYSKLMGVDVLFVSDIIDERRGKTKNGKKCYTLADVYPHADLVTYPSMLEGFGNAFLEAVYFKKPIVVNSYTIYLTDIKPKGFKAVEFDNFITQDTVHRVEELLDNEDKVREMTEVNYCIAKRHFSYAILKNKLRNLLCDHFGYSDNGHCSEILCTCSEVADWERGDRENRRP